MNESAVAEDQAVFDLEALKRRCLGNLGLVERVLRKFTTQLAGDLAELKQALEEENAESFALVSHRIKGMSANVEARELHRAATTAEQRALAGSTDGMRTCLHELRHERERVTSALAQLQL